MHGEAIELAGKAHGKIADVDHLLDFAETLDPNLPHFQGDEFAQRLLIFAQQVPQVADHLAALGRWQAAPLLEGMLRRGDHASYAARSAGIT